MNLSSAVILIVFLFALPAAHALSEEGFTLHPDNPKYFQFRGKPVVLLGATEHYGSVINRPFNFQRYLDDAAAHKMTVTRTFLLFRELQSARNPSSPCKPESPDYLAPFPRTGPGTALDGEPTYDLDQWNPEYWTRLHSFLEAASQRGIIVELTLFSNTYTDSVWALNPFRSENNIQRLKQIDWEEYISLKDPELVRREMAYARKVIQETSQYDNIYYEICNEPGGAIHGHASPADVDAWQAKMASAMRDEMNRLNRTHLVAGQQAFSYEPKFLFPQDGSYSASMLQIVNVHPLPDTMLREQLYQLGHFMSAELMLSEVSRFAQAAFTENKPTVLDEDNAASMYRDLKGWTIHRKRAWTALLNGAHYNYIDFSITVGSEDGTAASRGGIRSWMQHLSEFISSFDFIHAEPSTSWVRASPPGVVASGLVIGSRDYAAYLGDAREVSDPTHGQPIIGGTITLFLPPGKFSLRLYSPVTGEYSPGIRVDGGSASTFDLPSFREDIVVRATRVSEN